jgi:hypothetical protein
MRENRNRTGQQKNRRPVPVSILLFDKNRKQLFLSKKQLFKQLFFEHLKVKKNNITISFGLLSES